MHRHEQELHATISFMRLAIATNTISQLIGKAIGAGATFAISLLLARQFGVEGYGDFVKISTYVAFFFLIADFGLNAIYLQRQKETQALPALLAARLTGGFFLIFLSLAILAFLPSGETQGYTNIVNLGIILFSPAILFQGLITTANGVFQKHLRYDISTVALAAGSIVSVGTVFILLRFSIGPAITGPLALLAGSVITCAVALVGVKKLGESLTISFSPKEITPLFLRALPLGLTLLFTLIYGHVDSVILTLTRNTTEVGIYGLAYKVFELFLVFPTFFMNSVYPMMLKTNGPQLVTLFKKSFVFLFAASCCLSVIAWVGAPLIVYIQEGFMLSVLPLRVLSISLPLFFISALIMWTLIALKKQTLLVFIYGGAMILNIATNIWLIPMYGYMAAAWITVLSEGLVLLISGLFLLRYIR
jgi:O-antigen/teichoic acid export membrane protein